MIKIKPLTDRAKTVLERNLQFFNIKHIVLGSSYIVEECTDLWYGDELYVGYKATILVESLTDFDINEYNMHP
ncbi:hypothetical protein VPHD479_0370 [Vibrio phage D479]